MLFSGRKFRFRPVVLLFAILCLLSFYLFAALSFADQLAIPLAVEQGKDLRALLLFGLLKWGSLLVALSFAAGIFYALFQKNTPEKD